MMHAYLELFAENAAMLNRARILFEIAPTADAPALQTFGVQLPATDPDPRRAPLGPPCRSGH